MIDNKHGNSVIYVDADACPVKNEIIDVARDFNTELCFVASYDHQPNQIEQQVGEWLFIDPGKDSVDLFILNRISKNNILITQDIGLASLALSKGVYVLSPRGKVYREESIQTDLDIRYLSSKERRRRHYGKGPKPFTSKDRHNFVENLTKLLSNIEGK